MKKLLLFLLLFPAVAAVAQSFTMIYNDEEIADGSTINYQALHADDNELIIQLCNNSTVPDSIFLTKNVIEEVAGTYNTFCIGGSCVLPTTMSSNSPLVLQPGACSTGSDFHLLYTPGGNEGTTTVRYTLRAGNFRQSFIINYTYGETSGIETNNASLNTLNAYPNPANGNVTIQYELSGNHVGRNTNLTITNLVGRKILVTPLNSHDNHLTLDLSNLDAGIYFYSLEINGKVVSTKKLIVK